MVFPARVRGSCTMGSASSCFGDSDSRDAIRRESAMEGSSPGYESVSVTADTTSTETVNEMLERIEAETEEENDVDSDRSDADAPQVRGCAEEEERQEREHVWDMWSRSLC